MAQEEMVHDLVHDFEEGRMHAGQHFLNGSHADLLHAVYNPAENSSLSRAQKAANIQELAKVVMLIFDLEEALHAVETNDSATAEVNSTLEKLKALDIFPGHGLSVYTNDAIEGEKLLSISAEWGNGTVAEVVERLKTLDVTPFKDDLSVDEIVEGLQILHITDELHVPTATVAKLIRGLKASSSTGWANYTKLNIRYSNVNFRWPDSIPESV